MEINEINNLEINPNKFNDLSPILVDKTLFEEQGTQETTQKEIDRQSKATKRKFNAENPSPVFKNSEINSNNSERKGFILERDTAQYKGSDYANAVRIERGISLDKAFEIAESDSNIDYFVYLKGGQMVLEIPSDVQFDSTKDPLNLVSNTKFRFDSGDFGSGNCRIFRHGDVVFFKKEGKWLGSAPGLADTYSKEKTISK